MTATTPPTQPTAGGGIGEHVHLVHLAACLAAFVVVLGATSTTTRAVATSIVCLATPVLTLLAQRWYRPVHRWAWRFVAIAETLWIVSVLLDPDGRVPAAGTGLTVSEILSTVGYLAAIAALYGVGTMADRGRRALSDIDAGVVVIAVLSVVWAVNRVAAAGPHPARSAYAGLAYPVFDAFIGVLFVRLAARSSWDEPAYLLALGGVGGLLLGDLAGVVDPPDGGQRVTQTIQFGVFCLLGLAATHPGMAAITDSAAPAAREEIGRVRLAVIGAALVTPPLALIVCGHDVDRLTAVGLLSLCAVSQAVVLVRLSGIVEVVEEQSTRLRGLARSDHLTTLPNRRTIDNELGRAVVLAAAHAHPLVVALLDLDHFKAFNDSRGHAAGDRLLHHVATTWKRMLPAEAFIGRYGGEEFLVLVRGRHLEDVAALLNGLREHMPDGTSFSAGLAEWDGLERPTVLVTRADRALYAAKDGGRACTWAMRVPGAEAQPTGR